MQLYGYGLSDREIGKRIGVTKVTIAHWRKRRGLAPNKQSSKANVLPDKVDKERLTLWRRGMTDADIAARLGCTRQAIALWRRRNGHKRNDDVVGKHRHVPADIEQRMKLYRLGRTDRQIADAQGVSRGTVTSWRNRNALDANDGKPNPDGPARLVSMDADLGEGGFNRHAFIADDAAAAWLEEMGATKW